MDTIEAKIENAKADAEKVDKNDRCAVMKAHNIVWKLEKQIK